MVIRAAIPHRYFQPLPLKTSARRRMSSSSVLVLAGVAAAHLGLALYLYTQHFIPSRPEALPETGPVVISLQTLKPDKPTPQKHQVVKRDLPVHIQDTPPLPRDDTLAVPPPKPTEFADPGKPAVLPDPVFDPPADPEPIRHVIRNPNWLSRPTGDELADAYPQRALLAGKSGVVSLACTVLATGALADCSVAEETPAGWGFGKAALGLTRRFRLSPRLEDGSPVGGALIRIPIRFSAPG